MICAVICRCEALEWEIESWLMSCRVLNRKVEQAVCNRLARAALDARAETLVGLYLPTARNHIVADLYAQLGFTRVGDRGEAQCWQLHLRSFRAFDLPMAEVG
jgi:predicted enzyme involved in methoxymalonyl-ACP biosynthesis